MVDGTKHTAHPTHDAATAAHTAPQTNGAVAGKKKEVVIREDANVTADSVRRARRVRDEASSSSSSLVLTPPPPPAISSTLPEESPPLAVESDFVPGKPRKLAHRSFSRASIDVEQDYEMMGQLGTGAFAVGKSQSRFEDAWRLLLWYLY